MDLPPPSNPHAQRPPIHLVAPLTGSNFELEKPIFRAPDLEPLVRRASEKVFKRRPFKPRNRR